MLRRINLFVVVSAVAFNIRGLLAIFGTTNSETITGTAQNEVLYGNGGTDTLNGGAGNDTLYGASGNDTLDGGTGADQMAGGAGDDTYIVDEAGDVIAENANEGTDTVRSSISYTLGANLENIVLTDSANLNATGNSLANVLRGNSGNNILDGKAGADSLIGGLGDDTYVVDNAGDAVLENANEGTDTVQSSIAYTLGSNVENLTLTGGASVSATGNDLANVIRGNTGSNVIDGRGGADAMIGGTGNDTYVVDHVNDSVVELAGQGTDTVNSSISYALGANVENLVLTGTAAINGTGNELANRITGNASNNVLMGGDGNDTLTAGAGNDTLDGGTGNDRMTGGLGDDTYVVDSVSDVVVEAAGEGNDRVFASVTTTLSSNVEALTLTGSAAINGIGNSSANTITGNAANNLLDGRGGADTLIGGQGDDTYAVDNVGDVVVEAANEGSDTVQSSISYTLGINLENLTLTGTSGLQGTGNDSANTIRGNGGSNTIDGRGGADLMIGGAGNDTYIVDDVNDAVVELAGEGTDTVRSSITYTLGANVENLILTGSLALNGSGNDLVNQITGNGADNVLSGGGGNDTLTGGAGIDTLDGGTGDDRMVGGTGDDTYVADSAGDVVVESSSQGTDQVLASVTFTLATNVEKLTLTGTSAVDGIGNTLANTITGNDANNILDGRSGADLLIGGKGDDTYVVDNFGDAVVELDNEGTDTVQSSINYTLAQTIENLFLTGTADLQATGNELANILRGNAGANILDGLSGADLMAGGAGNDTYFVDNVGDVVVELENEGTDAVYSSVSYGLPDGVENLVLSATPGSSGGVSARTSGENLNTVISGVGNELANSIIGNDADNDLAGGAGQDVLDGGAGNDTLDGGTGADVMFGRAGDDTYVVDDLGDQATEAANEGTDTVRASISYTLGLNFENLTLTGSADLNGTGNEMANRLTGNAGANILDGLGGADILEGGAGDDTYVIDQPGDVIVENAGEGTDTVRSSFSYQLGANLENLILVGSAALDGTGNELANSLFGNSGDNVLDGRGGADIMAGGAGNDTYIVDNPLDSIVENSGEGTDTVRASITTVLAANVENLTLTGAAAINGTGNDLANVITGNAANNVLDGGTGADTLVGGAGDDTYYIDNPGDRVIENPGEGNDHVISTISIGAIDGVERITLAGTANIDLQGHGLDNTLTGNSGANVLSGGDGKDTLIGGAGDDTLNGDGGNDTLWGNDGHDRMNGGLGHDNLNGGAGNDIMDGGDGNDGFFGGGGNDIIVGGAGNDTINGDGGNDIIRGGAGNDVLAGGQIGSADAGGFRDTFAWMSSDIVDGNGLSAGFDTITDFGAGDRLDFSGIFNGAPPVPLADLIRVSDSVAGTIVSIDVDANGHFFDVAILNNVHVVDTNALLEQNLIIA